MLVERQKSHKKNKKLNEKKKVYTIFKVVRTNDADFEKIRVVIRLKKIYYNTHNKIKNMNYRRKNVKT